MARIDDGGYQATENSELGEFFFSQQKCDGEKNESMDI